ncbi:MAG TPA: NrfD/PsrC family molybdoenzyme membrane anchor subunit [Chthonomonadaceae bacterium]|nr:NrfD/PsrC family molybdoenzyme membrane anchor subunit [Chthonomonadaceae bacterium]
MTDDQMPGDVKEPAIYQPAGTVVIDQTLIAGEHNYQTIDNTIGNVVLNQRGHPAQWFMVFGVAFLWVNIMLVAFVWLLYKGVGIWGINIPVGWGFAIINFVWWIGIGHAGTLISAILLLLRQQWRNSINRFAEAMTLFAVMCAGLFPLLHTGRPWVAYWLFPYPNVLGMWPQFRSPLVWDVFAVSTYITVSALFWYLGLIPDFATMRDKARAKPVKMLFGMLAMGWRGSAQHWWRYETAYLILAGLSTPLVLSVHSVVSLDFAVSIIPGWHSTIFPPYFVAGAVYAGFAMVILLAIPLRAWYNLKDFITMKHLDWCAKIMLATGLVVFYGYLTEAFYAWYGGDRFEFAIMHDRWFGAYWPSYWLLIFCNGLTPQLLWIKKVRYSVPALFIISLIVSLGMWLERFEIVSQSLHHEYMPSYWGMYYGTMWDYLTFFGTLGFFTFMMFLFVRYVPMINMFEMKDLLNRITHFPRHAHEGDGHGEAGIGAAKEHA